jgi:hypothetical protein
MGISSLGAVTSGACNVGIGRSAMVGVTTGCQNIAIGGCTMATGTLTGLNNIAIGTSAATVTSSGCDNITIGRSAGQRLTTGLYNVSIGPNANRYVAGSNRNIGIGCTPGHSTNMADTINIGIDANKTATGTGCIMGCMHIDINDTSDCRVKRCITDSDLGLAFIKALRPVKYKWKIPRNFKIDEETGDILGYEDTDDPENYTDNEGARKSKQFEYGILAQEVETVLTDLGKGYYDFAGINDTEIDEKALNGKVIGTQAQVLADPDKYWNPGTDDYDPTHPDGGYIKLKSARYNQFIAPMMKAIQELDDKNIALAARVTDLE